MSFSRFSSGYSLSEKPSAPSRNVIFERDGDCEQPSVAHAINQAFVGSHAFVKLPLFILHALPVETCELLIVHNRYFVPTQVYKGVKMCRVPSVMEESFRCLMKVKSLPTVTLWLRTHEDGHWYDLFFNCYQEPSMLEVAHIFDRMRSESNTGVMPFTVEICQFIVEELKNHDGIIEKYSMENDWMIEEEQEKVDPEHESSVHNTSLDDFNFGQMANPEVVETGEKTDVK